MKHLIMILMPLLLILACDSEGGSIPGRAIYKKELLRSIPVTENDAFKKSDPADTVFNADGHPALATANREFMNSVIVPALDEHLDSLRTLSYPAIINELAQYTFTFYREYFGPSFYRWGGDLLDLDDPQPRGLMVGKRYGLDCSGFTTAPYDLAVHLSLIPDSIALFSSRGFKRYCDLTGFRDGGALDGGSNRYRLDTSELDRLGEEIFRIEKGVSPDNDDIAKLQPGDIAGRNGHFGIIVFIENEPYYLESGGWVVPAVGGYPVKAKQALKKFAENGYVAVRRCLK